MRFQLRYESFSQHRGCQLNSGIPLRYRNGYSDGDSLDITLKYANIVYNTIPVVVKIVGRYADAQLNPNRNTISHELAIKITDADVVIVLVEFWHANANTESNANTVNDVNRDAISYVNLVCGCVSVANPFPNADFNADAVANVIANIVTNVLADVVAVVVRDAIRDFVADAFANAVADVVADVIADVVIDRNVVGIFNLGSAAVHDGVTNTLRNHNNGFFYSLASTNHFIPATVVRLVVNASGHSKQLSRADPLERPVDR